MIASYTS